MEKNKQELSSEKKRKILSKLPYLVCLVGVALIIIRAFIGINKEKTLDSLVKIGNVECTHSTEAIIVKDETVLVRDTSKKYISTISSGEKVANNAIIATYKNQEYEQYLQELERMDNEILELMKNLPMAYSSETKSLINDINKLAKAEYGTTSYLDMQLNLNLCNELLAKKADIIANSSQNGSLIKELIDQRNKYIETSKTANDNIIATKSGIVSYETDNLENVLALEDVENYNFSYLKSKLDEIKHMGNIKIVNNYEAYIFAQVPIEYEKYLSQNKIYNLKIFDAGEYVYKACLLKYKKDETIGKVDITFNINSGIERLINVRDCQIEITWWSNSGMYVPASALYKYDGKDVYYVQIVKYGKVIQIPIVVKNNNGVYATIENYEAGEVEQLGLTRDYKLQVYDRLVIN